MRWPGDVDRAAFRRRKIALAVGHGNAHAVLLRQADPDVELGTQIRDEVDHADEAILQLRTRRRRDRKPFRPERQDRRSDLAAGAADLEATLRHEPAGRADPARKHGAASDEAGDEPVGRPLVELALAADLP